MARHTGAWQLFACCCRKATGMPLCTRCTACALGTCTEDRCKPSAICYRVHALHLLIVSISLRCVLSDMLHDQCAADSRWVCMKSRLIPLGTHSCSWCGPTVATSSALPTNAQNCTTGPGTEPQACQSTRDTPRQGLPSEGCWSSAHAPTWWHRTRRRRPCTTAQTRDCRATHGAPGRTWALSRAGRQGTARPGSCA